MICPRCSHENEEGVRFCVQCGLSLSEPLPPEMPAAPAPIQPPAPAQPAYTPPPPQAYPPPPQPSYPAQAAPTIQGPYPPMPQPPYPYPPQAQQPYAYPPQAQPPYGYPPQGAYPPPPYGAYPGYPPRAAAAPETGPWILRALPFIGGIAVLVGFILPWLGTSSDIQYSGGFKSLFDFYKNIFDGNLQYVTDGGQVALIIGALVAETLVPLMGLIGLIWSLTGTQKGRNSAVICGITGLLAQAASVILMVLLYSGGNLSGVTFQMISTLFQVGFFITLGGFLWMMITPAFAPKAR